MPALRLCVLPTLVCTAGFPLSHPRLHCLPSPLPTCAQRYSQGSVFKRSVLDMIAEELMSSKEAEQERGCPIGQGAVPIITDPQVRAVRLEGLEVTCTLPWRFCLVLRLSMPFTPSCCSLPTHTTSLAHHLPCHRPPPWSTCTSTCP